MANIGSAFLGDSKRRRVLSTGTRSTPPSSPPPSGMSSVFSAIPSPPPPTIPESPSHQSKPVVDSALSLELRLRWLEAILLGVKHEPSSKGKERETLSRGETLIRAAEDLQKRLTSIVNTNDGLKRFMDHYDQHAHLLTPDYALSETPPTYENMSASELEAFLVEMEPDIRAAERDMQEIEVLEKKGVTGAGKLGDYETFQPRLDALLKGHREDLELVASLEKRVARLMESHATQVDALSELFVAWDDTIMDGEDKIRRLELDRVERRRLGLE
ncbi:hypothetical protein R3P38DRAFT_3019916 [Favolaschia claudopus]|uniref:Uncharacterized protein n=1 Tax=Favolaschia claudopus TaxID=2862362 RepID=A0AAW0AHG4_9AGAR